MGKSINGVGNGIISVNGFKNCIEISVSNDNGQNWILKKVIKNIYGSKKNVNKIWNNYFSIDKDFNCYNNLFCEEV